MASLNTIDIVIPSFGMAMIGLLTFLASRELASDVEGPRSRLFRKHLNIAVIPLVIVFLSILFMNVADVTFN